MILLLFYSDPGSGMMLLQILLAFFASCVYYFRKYFYKIFRRRTHTLAEEDIQNLANESHVNESEV